MPGLAFRFRAFISAIGWSMESLMRATIFLSLEACELVPGPSCSPSAAVRNGERSDLVVHYEELREEGNGSHALGWIKDEEKTFPVLLYFVSNDRPRMPCMLKDHRHTFCHSYSPAERVVHSLSASLTRREVVRDPSHHLLGSAVYPEVKRTAV